MHGRGRRLGVRLRHRMAQNEVLRLYLAATRANGTKRRSTVFARAGIGVQACCARATDGGASPTLAAWGRNQAARSRLMVQCWDLGGPGNGPHLLLCSLAASRSARCSKDATPLSRSIGNQDRIVARVRLTHSPWFGCFPATMPLMPLPRPALLSVSRQSPNRSSILHTSGSGKRQRSPRGG
jgi:hypothetical protein